MDYASEREHPETCHLNEFSFPLEYFLAEILGWFFSLDRRYRRFRCCPKLYGIKQLIDSNLEKSLDVVSSLDISSLQSDTSSIKFNS